MSRNWRKRFKPIILEIYVKYFQESAFGFFLLQKQQQPNCTDVNKLINFSGINGDKSDLMTERQNKAGESYCLL